MVKVVPYLIVPSAKEAIESYGKIFGATQVSRMPYTEEVARGRVPDDFDYENSTMHATIDIGGSTIYMADDLNPPENPDVIVDVLLELDSKDQIQEMYDKAKKNGCKVIMDLEKTFWGAWFTRFVDPFGIGWQLNFQEDQMDQ